MSTLSDKITQFQNDVDLAHQVVHAGPDVTVETEGGPVRSLAKLIADAQAAFDGAGAGIVGQAQAAANLAAEKAQVSIDNAIIAAAAAMNVAAAMAGAARKDDFISFAYSMTAAELADALLPLPAIDLSVKVQAFIDANKGKRLLFPAPYRYMFAGVTLIGSTYDGTEIVFQGEHVLRARKSGSDNTAPIPAFGGIIMKDCKVHIDYIGHGNRLNQPDEEHVFNLVNAGAEVRSRYIRGREIKGDLLYMGLSVLSSPSPAGTLDVDVFDAENSADDGRNGLTIIAARRFCIGKFRSVKVGYIVTNVRQPGGLCLEPNTAFQVVENGVVGSVYIESAGGACLQIAGSLGLRNCRNIVIGPAIVINTSTPTANSPVTGEPAVCQFKFLNVVNVDGVTIPDFRGKFTNSYGDGAIFTNCSNVQAKGVSEHCRTGVAIGGDSAANDASGCDIDWLVRDICQTGFRTGALNDTRVSGKAKSPVAGIYSNVFAVCSIGAGVTQKDSTYSVSVPADSAWTRSYKNDNSFPVIFDNCVQRDSDRSGTWADTGAQIGDMKMPMMNVRGITHRSSAPPALATLFVDGQAFSNTGIGGLNEPAGWRFDATNLAMRPLPSNVHARSVSRNYQLTENFDAALYDSFRINIQSNPALTYNAPTGGTVGQRISIRIRNVSGGAMGAITWNAAFKMSGWTNPANQKNRVIVFEFDGTYWNEYSQSPADIPN